MKIIAVGRNYLAHAKEMNSEVPDEPVIFLKPDTALLKNDGTFYYPEFSNNIHYEAEIVIKISKEGKYIQRKFAHTHFEELTIGLDITARDIQDRLKAKGLPWELSKGFDHSAPIGDFISKHELSDVSHFSFSLALNGNQVQEGDTANMLFSFEHLIAFVSERITLKKGDLIFTGTPEGVGKIKQGDKLVGKIENRELLRIQVA